MILDLLYAPDGPLTDVPPPNWWNLAMNSNRAPFPWFGGKSKVAHLVWDRFGEVKNFVEPFAGSLAVLLGRPHEPVIETVNDYDGFVVNFWRAIQADPDKVAEHADWPVSEMDLHSRHKWLVKRKVMLRARLLEDPTFYDARIAGWWVWGLCAWIGGGWCQERGARSDGSISDKIPFLGGNGAKTMCGNGINAKSMRLPHLGAGSGGEDDHACAHYGKGVHGKGMRLPALGGTRNGSGGPGGNHGNGVHGKGMRLSERMPHLSCGGQQNEHGTGIHSKERRSRLHEVFRVLAQRLRYTRITCGDFERILSPAVTWRHGTTGVFLDPPYPGDAGSTGGIYSTEEHERETFDRAFRYCVENGANKELRIALCYYEGTSVDGDNVSEKLRSLGWDIVSWKAGGGYGGQSGTNQNATRERIAFSPYCLKAKQGNLFAGLK